MSRTSTPAQYALILIDLVESRGCPRGRLLEGTTLARTGITGIGARISDRDFALLVNNALRLTGNPALGLELGMRLNLSAHALPDGAIPAALRANPGGVPEAKFHLMRTAVIAPAHERVLCFRNRAQDVSRSLCVGRADRVF